jgi:hypothetical protein
LGGHNKILVVSEVGRLKGTASKICTTKMDWNSVNESGEPQEQMRPQHNGGNCDNNREG